MNAPFNPALLKQLQQRYRNGPVKMLIGGDWVEAVSGGAFETLNPSTGALIANVASGEEADVEVLAGRSNETEFDLSASIYTQNITTAPKLARRLKAGTVRINGSGGVDPALPLGGFKACGWGRENGKAGIEAYTELKAVSVSL